MADAGSANYTVGTHGTALAESQRGSRVWGYAFSQAAVAAVIVHTIFAAPQTQADIQPQVWGPQPASASTVIRGGLWAAPQQIESGKGEVWGPVPATASALIGRTFRAAPEQINSGNAELFGYTTEAAAAERIYSRYFESDQQSTEQWGGKLWGVPPPTASPIIARALRAAPAQIESGHASIWGLQPPAASAFVGKTFKAWPEQINSGSAEIWGKPPDSVQPGDVLPIRPIVVPPEQSAPGWAKFWGTPPPSLDVPVSSTFRASPEWPAQGYAKVWGTAVPEVLGTDVIYRLTGFWAPQQSFEGYAQTSRISNEFVAVIPVLDVRPRFKVKRRS